MFVCLFAVNAKTTPWIDAKRSGITKNDPESVLCRLKSPVLVFSGRYRDISGYSSVADRHFYLFPFHFRLLLRSLTQSAFAKRRRPCATSLLNYKWTSMDKSMYIQACLASSTIICMCALHVFTLKHIVAMSMTLLQLPNSLESTKLTLEVLSIKHWRQSAFVETLSTARRSRGARLRRASMLVT